MNTTIVNYTNILASASNELYIPATESPDSLAFLIKNNIIIEYNLIQQLQRQELMHGIPKNISNKNYFRNLQKSTWNHIYDSNYFFNI